MFSDIYDEYKWERVKDRIYSSTEDDLKNTLKKDALHINDIYPLFSPHGDKYLEEIAQISYKITRQRFGNVIQLYSPLYISNECTNRCLYCGFNAENKIRRITLTPDEIEADAEILYRAGFRHILLLTGENRQAVPLRYLAEISERIHGRFSSVSIEVYPMEADEYSVMINSGTDGLTLYQETYNKKTYSEVHPSGKKRDFYRRLNGPDRGGTAGFRKIGIGSLLGLSDWRTEGFFTALHALYLTKKYWKSHIQVSFPRLRKAPGSFRPYVEITDKNLTLLISAMRIILPDAGLVLSTRESPYLRDNLFPIGITMMSAGSKTEPGGYSEMDIADRQFDVEDNRTPEEIAAMIRSKGFDPVWKDWDREFIHT